MKRDLDLVRSILLVAEHLEWPRPSLDQLRIAGYSDIQIQYHLKLLNEAGFIDIHPMPTRNSSSGLYLKSLTWHGHEFVDACRDPSTWKKALKRIGEKAGSVGVDVLFQLLLSIAAEKLGLKDK